MKQKAKKLLKNPLIYGSSILVIGSVAANFFNFLFNLFMSRNLSVADYGVLASIISLVNFPMLIVAAIVPTVVSFTGSYFAKGQLDMVRGFYLKMIKPLAITGATVFLLFLFFISSIGEFFHIHNTFILLLADFIIFMAFINILNLALLQAKLAFGYQVFVGFVGAITKLLLGILFVYMGFSVTGGVLAILLSGLVVYIVSFSPIRFIFDRKITSPHINTKEMFSYGLPSALTLLGLTSFISSDILLVKHFFEADKAGMYAGLSLIARVIFYISYPIGTVMFPMIVQKHSKKENFTNTFKLALLLVMMPSIALTAFYFIFPEFSVLFFLKRTEYLEISSLVGLFGIYISVYCLLNIIANFYLSIKKTKIYIPIIIGALLQIVLIFFFHQTFYQIIMISLGITFLLVIGSLLHYPHATKKGS